MAGINQLFWTLLSMLISNCGDSATIFLNHSLHVASDGNIFVQRGKKFKTS